MVRILVVVILALAAYSAVLRRRLHAARMRGEMYHDIALRLDRQLADRSAS